MLCKVCKLQYHINCLRCSIAIVKKKRSLSLSIITMIDTLLNLHLYSRLKVRSYWHRGYRCRVKKTTWRLETNQRRVDNEWMGISNRNRNSRLACGAGWHTELEVTFPVLWPRNSHRGDSDIRRSINWMQVKSRRGAVRWELDRKRNRPPSGDGRF